MATSVDSSKLGRRNNTLTVLCNSGYTVPMLGLMTFGNSIIVCPGCKEYKYVGKINVAYIAQGKKGLDVQITYAKV